MAGESTTIAELKEPLSDLTLWRDWDYVTSMIASLRRYLFDYQTVPEWNFLLCGGKPELANPNSWVLSWPSLFAYLLSPNWAVIAFTLVLVTLGVWGYFRLFRLLTQDLSEEQSSWSARVGASAASIIAVFNGYFASHFNQGHINFSTFHLMPWMMSIFWINCQEISTNSRRARIYWMLLLVTWMFFTTSLPHGIFHFYPAFLLLVLVAGVRFGWRTAARASAPHILGIGCAIYRLGAVASWQMQWPRSGVLQESYGLMDVLAFSWRWVGTYAGGDGVEVFFPRQVWGYWEYNNYLGPVALLLAVLGTSLLLLRQRGRWLLVLPAFCIVAGLLLSLGNGSPQTPGYFFRMLPIISGLRVFTRYQILVDFGVALLVACVFCDSLWQRLGRMRTVFAVLLAMAVVGPPLAMTAVLVNDVRATPTKDILSLYPSFPKTQPPRVIDPVHFGHQTALIQAGYWVVGCYEPLSLGTSWIGGPLTRGKPESLTDPSLPSSVELSSDTLTLRLPLVGSEEDVRLRVGVPPQALSNLTLERDGQGQHFFRRGPESDALALRSVMPANRHGVLLSLFCLCASLFFCPRPTRRQGRWYNPWKEMIHQVAANPIFLSVGTVLVVLLPLLIGVPMWTEKMEMATYIILGTVFPAMLLHNSKASLRWRTFLIALATLCGATFIIWQGYWATAICAGIQALFIALWRRPTDNVVFRIIAFFLALVAWAAVARLIWWDDPQKVLWSLPLTWVIVPGVSLLMLSLVLSPAHKIPPRIPYWVMILATGMILACLSFRITELTVIPAFHHWGVIVGTIDAIRQGAAILWDFPSQYGFLSILSLASLPFASPWTALYVGHGCLVLVASLVLFLLLANAFPGWRGGILAVLTTVSLTFGLPGSRHLLLTPDVYPSIGAFRFIWCYVLMGLLVLKARYATTNPRPPVAFWTSGTVIWSLSVLWSAESAAFASTMWLPAYAISTAGIGSILQRVKRAAAWMLLPLLCLGLTIAIVTFIYWSHFGHIPDWLLYADYVRSEYFALPMDPQGPAWVLLLAIVAAATLLVHLELDPSAPATVKSLGYAGFGLMWGVSSYFVGRSHANNVLNLAPFIGLFFAVSAQVARLYPAMRPTCTWISFLLIPFIAFGTALTFANPQHWAAFIANLPSLTKHDVDVTLPRAPEDLEKLFQKAGIGPGDRIIYFSPEHDLNPLPIIGGLVTRPQAIPTTAMIPLTPKQRETYVQRFLAKKPCDGWFVGQKQALNAGLNDTELWFSQIVTKSCKVGPIIESGNWLARRLAPSL